MLASLSRLIPRVSPMFLGLGVRGRVQSDGRTLLFLLLLFKVSFRDKLLQLKFCHVPTVRIHIMHVVSGP